MRSPLLCLVPLLLLPACEPAPSDTIGEGEGEGGEGEGEGEDFELVASTTLSEAAPLAVPGFAVAARPDGRFAVAWFESSDQQVECQTFGGEEVVFGDVVVLKVGDEQPDGSVRIRTADGFVPTTGEDAVDLTVDGDGNLLIAYLGGEVTRTYCGASDLMLATESGDTFSTRTVAADANTSSTCRGTAGGDPYCGQGAVVGLYPSISVNSSGAIAMSYLDTHFGFGDTDITSSDLEVALGTPGSTSLQSINMESGAGYNGTSTIADDGTVIFGHHVVGNNQFLDDEGQSYVVSDGIYAEVLTADGTLNSSVIMAGGVTSSRVATATSAAGHFVAVHQSSSEQLVLFQSVDNGLTWRPSPVEQLGRVGRDPGMIFLDDGTLVLAYGNCRADTNQDLCNPRTDGVRFAKRLADGRFSRFDLRGDDEDLEGVGVDVAKSGPRELVAVHLNTSQNQLIVHRVSVR